MARALRIEYTGAVYHIMARANQGLKICLDDKDRQMWRATLAEACRRTGWKVHAWVLMGNHFHLLLETPEANLVNGMKWFQGTYTQRFNAKHRQRGHLFQGRYRAIPVEADTPDYFQVISTYIHLNPVRAKLVLAGEQKLWEYPWSSYPAYVRRTKLTENWLVTERVMGSLGLKPDDSKGYEAYMESRLLELGMKDRRKDLEEKWAELRRGWYLGRDEFRLSLLEKVKGTLAGRRTESYSGKAKQEHGEFAAELLLEKGLQALGIEPDDLPKMPKGQLEKQAMAWWLCTRTTVTRRWVGEHLSMGHASRITQVLSVVPQSQNTELLEMKRKLEKITD